MSTLLCAHVPSFKLAVAGRDAIALPTDAPVVLVDKAHHGRVVETNERARALGARIGQTILQARASAGGAYVLVHDASHTRAVWSDMLDALDPVTPLVDDTAEGTAYLEMRGIDGDVSQWIAHTLQALASFDLPVRVAAGANKFTARAATYGREIGLLPLDVLEIEPRIVERLHLLGVTLLGDLARLPHGPFVRRFGQAAAMWHDCARGIDPTPFRPRPCELQIDAAAYGEGTAAHEEQIYFALRVLAERIAGMLDRAGKCAAAVRMTFETETGDRREIDAGFAQPTSDPKTLLDVLRAKMEGVTFNAPIAGLRLQVLRLEERGNAATLFGQGDADPQALAVAMARLESVAGAHAHSAQVRPAHRLESRFAYTPFSMRQPRFAEHTTTALHNTPQLRLLKVREIQVTMRGNTPARVDACAVVDCAGPWRIDDGWFEDPLTRDEYDVLLDDGMLCRIYRQGDCWYLRGTYD